MSWKHCIRAAIGRRSTRAPSLVGRVPAILKLVLNLGAAWPQIPRPSSSSRRQRHSQQFISRAKEKGVRHGSIIESPNREAQTGTEGLRHILVVDDDPMVCMAIEVYLQRNDFRVTIAE